MKNKYADIRETFSTAAKYLFPLRRVKQKDLANEMGMSLSSLNDYVNGRREGDESKRRQIASALGISYEDMLSLGQWILDGNDPEEFIPERGIVKPFTDEQLFQTAERGFEIEGGILTKVPLISWVRAGVWTGIEDIFYPGEADEWITVVSPVGENSFALRVHGDSMSPEFNPGDIIIVDPDKQPENGSYVVAKIETDSQNGEATFKQFVRDADRVYLKPLNTQYPVMDMTGVKFKIVGKVVQKIKVY